jgi:neutral trehalase
MSETALVSPQELAEAAIARPLTPSQRWPGFFEALCLAEVRKDGIDIADMELRDGVADDDVHAAWKSFESGESPFSTIQELADNLVVFPVRAAVEPRRRSDLSQSEYSEMIMRRSARSAHRTVGTQIGVSELAMVPGGRFDVHEEGRGRLFYWDSLWTLYGAVAALGEWGIARTKDTLKNFGELADKLKGNIPNVNATWAEDRSQPPVLGRMVRLLAKAEKNDDVVLDYLELMEKHYAFWREGADDLTKLGKEQGSAYRRVVRMPNGKIMYRFYDDGPDRGRRFRDEMWLADKHVEEQLEQYLEQNLGRPLSDKEKKQLGRNLGAGAEHGEDFTGEDCDDYTNLYTIRTTEMISVKLNSLQYDNATMLAFGYYKKAEKAGSPAEKEEALTKAKFYEQEAADLAEGINEYCIAENGFCANYDFVNNKRRSGRSMTGVFALSSGIIPQEQGKKMLETMEELFLREGGFVNTLHDTDMQWDKNVWPLMQMEAIHAAIIYGRHDLALKWCLLTLKNNRLTYLADGLLWEKTHPDIPGKKGGRGEYACVEDLLMSHGVDMALRKMLPMLLEKVAGGKDKIASLKQTGNAVGALVMKAIRFMNDQEAPATIPQQASAALSG